MESPEQRRRRRHRNERIVAGALVLVVAAITIGVIRYVRTTDRELASQTTYVPKPTVITPEVELLRQYIRFDTSNPPGNELPAARWLAGILRDAGVEAEIIETAPQRANVYARIKGKRHGGGLLLLHHIDVVPANPAGWTRPPFAADIRLDQLYGRGALDMKGPAIAFLRAFLDVAQSGRQPAHDLVYLGVADEETGSTHGMKWLVEHRPEIFDGVAYALNEGGITEMRQETVTYYGIEIGTKVTVIVNLVAPQREQLQRARIALEPEFTPNREPGRVLPLARRFFRDVAPQRIEFNEELADIDRTIAEGKFWRLPVGYRELTQNNVWCEGVVARPAGGFAMRTLLLNLPDEDPERRIGWLTAKVKPFGVRVGEVLQKEGPVPLSSPDTPFFDLIRREATAAFRAPVGTEFLNRFTNDSRFLRERGIDAYGINPFAVDFFQSESIHGTDERLRVEYFTHGIGFARRLVHAYAFD